MTSDLGRATIAVGVGMFLPLAVDNRWRPALGPILVAAVTAWGCGPVLDRWEGWAIVVCATAGGLLVSRGPDSLSGARRAILAVGVVAAIAMALLGWNAGWDAVGRALGDDGVVVVGAGALLVTFVGGIAIGALLRPLATGLERIEGDEHRIHAGLYIGWLERALLYGFIVAGAPGAAAVVVATKSIARFPSFKDERFAEYYLIGTLASVLLAAGAAVAVRALLGLGPLVK